MSYSQLNEEQVIARYFGDHVGTFLDIGANDGKTFSNTYALALKGWSGVCVEPSPKAFERLEDTYKGNPDVLCVNVAVTTENGPIVLHEASDTLVSSLSDTQPKDWAAYNFDWREVEVKGVTFDMLLAIAVQTRYDFISIDAEKHDMDILRQIDLDQVGCRLLCIEHGDNPRQIEKYCTGFRRIALNGINLILGR
jgi:FkbM family methyltransferase